MPYMECRHIKTSGCKCEAPALRGKAYCYYHMRLHQAIQARKAAPQPSPDLEIDVPAVEDTRSIQLALTEILKGLGAKRVDPRRAGRLLYGLQIAALLVERSKESSPEKFVQSLTTTKDGDELAPKAYECDDDDDCNECPYADDCNGWEVKDEAEKDEVGSQDREDLATKANTP